MESSSQTGPHCLCAEVFGGLNCALEFSGSLELKHSGNNSRHLEIGKDVQEKKDVAVFEVMP